MFPYHKLNEAGLKEMEKFKTVMANAMKEVLPMMPEGRAKAMFNTEMEYAVYNGSKAIAGKEGNFSEKVEYGE